jgi:nickel-dependent lactate racemase
METVLRYGSDQSIRLEFANGELLADCAMPRGKALDDPAAALTAALDEPLDYPRLSLGTTPGDRVVLAVERGLPEAAALVAAAIDYVVHGSVELDGISILQTKADAEAPGGGLDERWPETWKQRIGRLRHDPADHGQLAYLATTESGETIFLNRALTDADVVLPIGSIRRETAAGYFGIHGAIFPGFSNEKMLAHFGSLTSLQAKGDRKKRLIATVDEVSWLLGLAFTIQVVPAGGDRVLAVLAGQPAAVRQRGRELYRAAWHCAVPQRASLVVATIEGNAAAQTWQNVGRALSVAGRLVEDGGSIALCCELAEAPGPAIQCLAELGSREEALVAIRQARPADALAAAQLAAAVDRGNVFFLSNLEESLLENLEIAAVGGADELARLVRRHPSCIVLSNAPYAAVHVEQDNTANG